MTEKQRRFMEESILSYRVKKAADEGGMSLKDRLADYINVAKAWYENRPEWQKTLLGAGAGGLAGAGVGSAIRASTGKSITPGALWGALLGALGGGAYTTDWKRLLGKGQKEKVVPNYFGTRSRGLKADVPGTEHLFEAGYDPESEEIEDILNKLDPSTKKAPRNILDVAKKGIEPDDVDVEVNI